MSEVNQWLMSIGIPGIERLADEFESWGFSTRKSLQYLQDGDLDYIFSSPKGLLLVEKRLYQVKYLNRQELDKDLLYLHKALENKVPPESEDWHLPYLIDTCKGQVSSLKESAALIPISSPANPPENSFYNGFSVNYGANLRTLQRFFWR